MKITKIVVFFGILFFQPIFSPAWEPQAFKKPTTETLKTKLTPLQFEVTQKAGTEPSFQNEFWNQKKDGIYVDIVSGEPLFSSLHKYDSGTGWPSFYQPLDPAKITKKVENGIFSSRTEVRSKTADSHLGHVFTDGPKPTGLRYCINSAALKFIPTEEMKEKGYEEYLKEFTDPNKIKNEEKPGTQIAIFAGGCFWCMQPPFDVASGVISTRVGYTGGAKKNPTYEEVSAGGSGHKEAIEVKFDSTKTSYENLLAVFWKNIDPFDATGQFCDKGDQYKSAIYSSSAEQKLAAEASIKQVTKKDMPALATAILPAQTFFAAEDYHQDYYKKNPIRYKLYRYNCGRDQRLKTIWGSESH